ncbi:MAG: gliding motility-associated C-terminal domain-containing protein, partial [Flammeovirgaceae bacterium]
TNVAVGSYQIDVMDANGCSVATTVVIGPPPPLMQLSVTSTDALCNLNDGTAQAKVVGGKAPYQFTWTPSAGSTASVINLAVGMHGVTVKDSNGCAVTYGTINIGAPLTTMSVDLTATGESYQLRNGTASVDVQGGYPPYRYQWTPLVGDKAVFLGLPAGSYSVFVTDAKGCTISGTVSVNPIPPIDIPNAFTPNQDGINDYWMIGNIAEYPRAKVQVFNRWGNELFFSNGYVNPWDGTVQGKIFPVDTYYYIIDLQIGIKPFVGYVDIIR